MERSREIEDEIEKKCQSVGANVVAAVLQCVAGGVAVCCRRCCSVL